MTRDRKLLLGAGLLLALGALLRLLASLDQLFMDEVWTFIFLREVDSLGGIFTSLHVDGNHYLTTVYLYLLGEQQPFPVYRLPAILAGVGTVALTWPLARPHGRLAALTAVLLTATSYLLVHFSSEARGYAPLAFCTLLAFLLMRRYLDGRRSRDGLLFAASTLLGILSHLLFLHTLLGLGFWWLLCTVRAGVRRLVVEGALCFGLAATLLVGLYLVDLRHMASPGGPDFALAGVVLRTASQTLGGPPEGALAVLAALALTGLFAVGLVLHHRRGSLEGWPILVTAVLSPILAIVLTGREAIYLRYFVAAVTLAYLLVAVALAALYRSGRAGQVGYSLLLALVLAGNAWHLDRQLRLGRGSFQEVVRRLAAETDGPEITIGSDHEFRHRLVFQFYARELPPGKVLVYRRPGPDADTLPEWILKHDFVPGDREVPPRFQSRWGPWYELLGDYPCGGLSCWNWALYRKVPAAPD